VPSWVENVTQILDDISDTNTAAHVLVCLCQRNKDFNIDSSWKNDNGKVVVMTADGRSFDADHVIVTVSLGNIMQLPKVNINN
jgi:hypothetical protein